MNALIQLALEKYFVKAGKETQFKPAVGVHEIDEVVTLHIKGTLTKGKDKETTPTVSIPLKLALGLFLERAGFQREGMMDLLVESMSDALKLKEKGEEFVKDKIKDVEVAEQRVKDMLGKLPKTPTDGATTIKLTVEQLEPELAAA